PRSYRTFPSPWIRPLAADEYSADQRVSHDCHRGRAVSESPGLGWTRRQTFADQLKESPQAQEPVAFGLSIVKPCFSMVSTKSIEAPWTYGALIRSTVSVTPLKSAVRSPSSARSSKNRLYRRPAHPPG